MSALVITAQILLACYQCPRSISHRPIRAALASSSGSPSHRTTERSPSSQSQQHQSRGRHCGRRPDEARLARNIVRFDGRGTYDREVTTDRAWVGSEWVGGTEESTAGLHGIFTFPYHCADGTTCHICVRSVSDCYFE